MAKRIQENTSGGKILMSRAVHKVVKNSVDARIYQEMTVRGRERPVTTVELLPV